MTDAQPGDQLVAVLEAADTLLGQAHAAWDWRGADAKGEPQGESYQCFLAASEKVEDALPIARAMAERERELVAAARRVNAQWPMISDAAQVEGNREAILAMADLDDALRAYDRARAAGVEVTGHE